MKKKYLGIVLSVLIVGCTTAGVIIVIITVN